MSNDFIQVVENTLYHFSAVNPISRFPTDCQLYRAINIVYSKFGTDKMALKYRKGLAACSSLFPKLNSLRCFHNLSQAGVLPTNVNKNAAQFKVIYCFILF